MFTSFHFTDISRIHPFEQYITEKNQFFSIVCHSVTTPTWFHNRKRYKFSQIKVVHNLLIGTSIGSYKCEGTKENGEKFVALSFVWPSSM